MLIVTDSAGIETTGKIASLSPSSLTLLSDGLRREWREIDVATIKQRRADSLANGAPASPSPNAASANMTAAQPTPMPSPRKRRACRSRLPHG
jgi:hypothetical protein